VQSKRFARLMEKPSPRHRGGRTAEGGVGGKLRSRIDALLCCAQTPPLAPRIPAIALGAADDRAHSD
jgi:hypothetical protein